VDGFSIKLSGNGAVVEFGASLADKPIIGVVLKLAKFKIGEGGNVWSSDAFRVLGQDAIDASTLWEVDGISADVGVVPVEDVDATIRSNFHTEANPGEIVGGHEITPVSADVGGAIWFHVIGEDGMLVDVAHEELVVVFGGEGIGQIEAGSAVRREVGVVADRLDGRVGVGVEVGAGLFVVDAALDDVEEMGDDAAGGKAVAEVIEVEAPRIGEAASEDFEFASFGVEAPDAGVEVEAVVFGSARFPDEGVGENALAAVEPAVGSPDEAVQSFVAVVHAPAVEKNFGFGVGNIVAIGVGNENKIRRGSEVDTTVSDRDTGSEGDFIVEEFLGVKDAVAIGVLKNLDAAELFVFVRASVDVVIVFYDPDASPGVEGKGNGFADVRLGGVDGNVESLRDGHFGYGFLGREEGSVAGAVLLATVLGKRGSDRESGDAEEWGEWFHLLGEWDLLLGLHVFEESDDFVVFEGL